MNMQPIYSCPPIGTLVIALHDLSMYGIPKGSVCRVIKENTNSNNTCMYVQSLNGGGEKSFYCHCLRFALASNVNGVIEQTIEWGC